MVCVLPINAQSGRRQPKTVSAAPVPTPSPEPTPTPKEKPKSDLSILVGLDRSDTFSYYPSTYYSVVLDACSRRLSRGSDASVNTSDHLTRGEAIKKAKSDKTTYVVLLRLVTTFIDRSQRSNDDEIELEYVVFSPLTAKIATSGRTYQNARTGPVIVRPPGSSSILYREQLLKRAAENAADRILSALHLATPSRPVAPASFQPLHKDAR